MMVPYTISVNKDYNRLLHNQNKGARDEKFKDRDFVSKLGHSNKTLKHIFLVVKI